MLNEFSIELASELSTSDEMFPVEFDKAWVWLGYSRKDNAKRFFLNLQFQVDVDYTSTLLRNEENIKLTVVAFKKWGMRARTEQGDRVCDYFLECEKIAKAKLQPQLKSKQDEERAWLEFGFSLVEKAMSGAGLPKALAAQAGLAGVRQAAPRLAAQIEPAMQALINSTASDNQLLNVTQLGKQLGLSAKATNKLLIEKGFQVPNSKKTSARDLNYTPTELGERYSQVVQSADSKGKTFQQLRWQDKLFAALHY